METLVICYFTDFILGFVFKLKHSCHEMYLFISCQ